MRMARIIAAILGIGVAQAAGPAGAQTVPALQMRSDLTMQDLENAAARNTNAQSYAAVTTSAGPSGNLFQAAQTGDYNTITALQSGNNNLIQIVQAGQQNVATVSQTGSYNRVTLRQGR
ncbi:hypothetical protein MEX01_23740 [Methylorubrum extorquens]|uniref:curlin repeat-containing protein n=1 Tax=Methylorubrum extorquens TaxID=408 RepID=UPI00116FC057|nr:curlin repeat-containing protein [Methylorubrum extorquens]GEL41783.1 hypothetical protein MEX01_23740 [Methylorubrum extorquens]